MAVRNSRSATSDHRRHDRLLVARFAVGDAEFGQEREAKDLIHRCSECADLAADIGYISRGVAQLPAPRRTRDFRLTAEQADKLRGSAFERFFRTLSGSGWAVVRPAAAVALSIGMVMSVVGVLPILGFAAGPAGAPVSAPTSDQVTDMGLESFPNPTDQGGILAPGASGVFNGVGNDDPARNEGAPPDDELNNAYVKTDSPQPELGRRPLAPADRDAGLSTGDVLFVGGIVVSVLALAVLMLIYAARRRFTDSLLR